MWNTNFRFDEPGPVTHASDDPNALVGPAGYGTQEFIQPSGNLSYTVEFENDGSLAAQTVDVSEQLSTNLDWSTFQLGSFGFGSINVTVPAGLTQYQTTVDYENTDGTSLDVEVSLDFNVATGLLTGSFTSLDPLTGQAPTGVFDGFLYPESTSAVDSEGFVQYTVQPTAGLTTGDTINQQAAVVFDINPPLNTALVTNTIDSGAPTSSVSMLPTDSPSIFTVNWSGTDDTNGSGIATYSLYVSDDNGPFVPYLQNTADTSTTFSGTVGHTYGFYTVATDNVGNVQPTPTMAQASTTVNSQSTGVAILNLAAGGLSFSEPVGTADTLTITESAGNYVLTNTGGFASVTGAGTNQISADVVDVVASDVSASLAITLGGELGDALSFSGTGSFAVSGNITLAGADTVTQSSTFSLAAAALSVDTSAVAGSPSHGTVSLTDASNAISLFAAKTDGGAVNLAGTGSLTIGTVSGLSGVDTSDGGSMPAGADAVFDLLGSITVAKSVAAALLSLTAPTVNFDVALSPAALGVQGNSVFDGGSVATTGSQTYSGSVTLEQSTTLSSRVGPLNVMGTIDGAFNLIADSDGVITFGGAVGGFVPLASLTGQGKSNPAAGLTQLDASVTTAGSQFYNNPLLLAGNPALDSSAGNITFGSTVGGNSALSTSAPGKTTFDGLVSIASLTAAGTVVQIINGPINTVNSQEYDAHVLVQNNPSLFASQGNITFDSTVGGNSALSTSAPGTTTFDGLVSIASLTVGPSAGYGIAQINAGPINTVGSQIYNAILLLANNPALTSSQGNITFNSTVGGNSALTTASPGTTTFNALVSIASLSTSNFSGFGTTNIDTASINTVGGQTYNAPVLLGGEDPTLASANGNITFNSTVGGNAALVINNPGTTIFNALVSIASIQVNGPAGAVKINGGMMMTTGAQTYQNQVALSGSTSLISSAGGNIEFDMRVTNSTSNRLDLTVQTTGKHIYRHGVESAIHVINKS